MEAQDGGSGAKTISQAVAKLGAGTPASWFLLRPHPFHQRSVPLWVSKGQPSPAQTHLVVQKDSEDGCHHAQDVGAGDRVPQHDEGHRDDHDPLGGVGDRVAQRADEVEDAEGDDILGNVTEAADSQEQERPRPLGHRGLQRWGNKNGTAVRAARLPWWGW